MRLSGALPLKVVNDDDGGDESRYKFQVKIGETGSLRSKPKTRADSSSAKRW
jgi:hypothetical protein